MTPDALATRRPSRTNKNSSRRVLCGSVPGVYIQSLASHPYRGAFLCSQISAVLLTEKIPQIWRTHPRSRWSMKDAVLRGATGWCVMTSGGSTCTLPGRFDAKSVVMLE